MRTKVKMRVGPKKAVQSGPVCPDLEAQRLKWRAATSVGTSHLPSPTLPSPSLLGCPIVQQLFTYCLVLSSSGDQGHDFIDQHFMIKIVETNHEHANKILLGIVSNKL